VTTAAFAVSATSATDKATSAAGSAVSTCETRETVYGSCAEVVAEERSAFTLAMLDTLNATRSRSMAAARYGAERRFSVDTIPARAGGKVGSDIDHST